MFSISINGNFELTGYSAHITGFLALRKVLLTYIHKEMISKVFIILFLLYLCGTLQLHEIFSIQDLKQHAIS